MTPIAEAPLALSYDDVLLQPNYSEVVPRDVRLRTRLADGLELAIPLLSAAMDSVSEAPLAIALARLGGLAVLHKNLTVAAQADEVAAVKAASVAETSGDLGAAAARFSTIDAAGRLRCAAAIGPGPDGDERAAALVAAGVDLLVVDTAHGHSRNVIEAIQRLRARYPHLAICGGNVATAEATAALFEAGADIVKVGIGPGSICTTRVVAGVGVPQLTAIMDVVEEAARSGTPIVADGGIKFSGDLAKAIAGGAHCAMIGSLLAGTDEAPGEVFLVGGRSYKQYRGMGSLGAMARGSADRYFQQDISDVVKMVPEGIEGRVPYKGPVHHILHQLSGGLRSSMGYTGNATLDAMRTSCQFVRISSAGLRESHVHDVVMMRDAPNYQTER